MIHISFSSFTQNHMFANTIPFLIRLYIVRTFPYDAIHAKQQQQQQQQQKTYLCRIFTLQNSLPTKIHVGSTNISS